MSRKIIALSGEMNVGKDTFAEPLVKVGWNKGSFAANLKKMCQQIFNIPPYLTDTQEGKMKAFDVHRDFTDAKFREILRWISKTHDMTGCQMVIEDIKKQYIIDPTLKTGKTTTFRTSRELLQFVGTEVCRRISLTYHIDVLQMEIERIPGNWVITDARFANEREMLKKELGATLVRIKRPGYEAPTSAHASEVSLGVDEDYDVVINNSGTIEELKAEAKRFL